MRRQYMLPNCTLIIDGFSDVTAGTKITTLVNVECQFIGMKEHLNGGKDFFESLVKSVSDYAQEFLSGVPHFVTDEKTVTLVHLHKLENLNLHRLKVDSNPDQTDPEKKTTQIDLTTVQLFDLVEAIDQFLADSNTLPDITVNFAPISKEYALGREPIVKRATPLFVGIGSIAFLGIISYFLPIPEVKKPDNIPQETQTKATNTPTSKPQINPTSTPEIQSAINDAQIITDTDQLSFLTRRIQRQISQKLEKNPISPEDNLVYRLTVDKQGLIFEAKPTDKISTDKLKVTPLPDLIYIPPSGNNIKLDGKGDFKVVFTQKGAVQVSPWEGSRPKQNFRNRITDPKQLNSLEEKLSKQIEENQGGNPTFRAVLIYRVAVNKEGNIVDYEPFNNAAYESEKETALPKLLPEEKFVIPQPNESLAQFRLEFKRDGKFNITPWRK